MTFDTTLLPAILPASPKGFTRRLRLHLKVSGGGRYVYDCFDPAGNEMPFGYIKYSGDEYLAGFTLPEIERVMSWEELRAEWPKWLARQSEDAA